MILIIKVSIIGTCKYKIKKLLKKITNMMPFTLKLKL
jgi:hypothetical protein